MIIRRSRSPRRGGRDYRDRSPSYRRGDRNDSRSRDLKEGRCFHCGERGHMKRDCPNLRRSRSRGGRDRDRREKKRSYSSSRSRGNDTSYTKS